MLVYYRLCRGKKSIYDRIIRWATRGNYTHAEFAWPLNCEYPDYWLGAQPKGGVQIRNRNYLTGEYDVFSLFISRSDFDNLRRQCQREIGKPYDWMAIVRMGIRPLESLVNVKRWFCSEYVFYKCYKVGIILLNEPENLATRITPRDLGLSTVANFCYRGSYAKSTRGKA